MSAPVPGDDIVSGTVAYLLAQPDAVAAVTRYVISGQSTPAIFQYRPWTKIEGTSGTAVIITSEGGWAGPNIHNTLRFPRLTCHIWADPQRDASNNVIDPGEVMKRVFAVYKVFDRFLHRPQGETVMFGSLRVIESVRLTEPVTYQITDSDGLIRCQTTYAVTEG